MPKHIIDLVVDGDASITRHDGHASELQTAIRDILHDNHFVLTAQGEQPLTVNLSKAGQRVLLKIALPGGAGDPQLLQIPTKPLRGLMRDYFMMVESYQAAIRSHDTRKIEAVDMGRRGMHNEGAEMIQSMLEAKVSMDFNTARRLFTLVSILHLK